MNDLPPMPGGQVMVGPEQRKKIDNLLRQLVFPVTLPPLQGLGFTKVELYAGLLMAAAISKDGFGTSAKVEQQAIDAVFAAKMLFGKVRESYASDQKAEDDKAKAADKIIIP